MARVRGQGSKWIRPAKRQAIYHRDGFVCAYCLARGEDGTVLTLDHVVACELGGSNEATNLVTACLPCNSAKQDRTNRAWFSALRDRGVDTTEIAGRVRRQSARKLNMAEGHRLLQIRKGK